MSRSNSTNNSKNCHSELDSESSQKLSLPDNKPSLPGLSGQSTVTKTSGAIANCVFALAVFCLMFLITFVSGSAFFSVGHSSAVSEDVDIVVNIHHTIAITTDAADSKLILPIIPTHTGTLSKNELTVSVSTNNSTGYTLSINSQTTNTAMVHQLATGSPPAPNIPSTSHSYNTPAALGTDTWGWNLGSAASTSVFSMIPPSNASYTIRTTNAPSSTPSADSDTLVTFGANVTSNTPSGDYINTIVFTATANPGVAGPNITSISPTTNWSGGDIYLTGTDFPTTDVGTTIKVGGTDCLSFRLISATSAICVLPNKPTGSAYSVVMTSAALGQSNTNRTVTYDGATKGNMQDFSSTTCANMPMGLAEIYTDARDNAKYRVKKMLDNKCWMIDNLAYTGDGNDFYGDTHSFTFSTACGTTNYNTASVSNCNSATTWPGGTSARRFTTNNFTGGSLTDRMGNPIQNTEGNLSDNDSDTTKCSSSPTGSDEMLGECLSYLYGWCVAIGLTTTTTPTCTAVSETSYGSGLVESSSSGPKLGIVGEPGGIGGESRGNSNAANQAGIATTNGTLCPAGWRLPVGLVGSNINTSNEFAILNNAMYTVGQNLAPSVTISPNRSGNWAPAGSFSAVGSGRFDYATGLRTQSSNGQYWTSSLTSATDPAFMQLYSGSIYPGTSHTSKGVGMAVRCVMN